MKKTPLFDTHAHYDHPLFAGVEAPVLEKLFKMGVLSGVVIPAITWESNYQRELFPRERFPECFFAAGLHPKAATNEKWWDDEKKTAFSELLKDPRTVAVKTGLDYCKKHLTDAQKEHQIRFLRYLIQQAGENGLPLVFHVRDAMDEFIQMLRETPLKTAAEVHCFMGDAKTAEKLMSVGITHFGIGGMLTRDECESLRECVKHLNLDRILLETDSPFVKPKDCTWELNDSSNLMGTAELIARLKGVDTEEVVAAAEKNAREFFAIR
jgi:TatD DNase family protein